MIHRMEGDIFRTDVDAYVIPVNCVGVAGNGLIARFKQYYPYEYYVYKKACQQGKLQIGNVLVIRTSNLIKPKYIIAIPIRRHWKGRFRLEYLQVGLMVLAKAVQQYPIYSMAIPILDCGDKSFRDQMDNLIEKYTEKYFRGKLIFVLLPKTDN